MICRKKQNKKLKFVKNWKSTEKLEKVSKSQKKILVNVRERDVLQP